MRRFVKVMEGNWPRALCALLAAVAFSAALSIAPAPAFAADGMMLQGSSAVFATQSSGLSLNQEATVVGTLVRHEDRGSYAADGGDSNIVYYVVALDEPVYLADAGNQHPITTIQVGRLMSGARSSTTLVPFSEMADSQLEPLLGNRVTATGTLFLNGTLYMYSEYQLRNPVVTAAEEPLPGGIEENARVAYRTVLGDLVAQHGRPSTLSISSQGASYANGVGFVKLLDMDGDGASELLVSYADASSSFGFGCNTFEVWSFRDGEAQCDYSGSLGGHGTNGYWPYIELYQRSDGLGCAYMLHGCLGSSPALFTEELWGYEDGAFVSLGKRAVMNATDAGGSASYYSDYRTRTGVSSDDEVSEADYAELFWPYLDASGEGPLVHAHLYDASYGVPCDFDAQPLEETIAGATATLQELGVLEAPGYSSDANPMHRLYNPYTGEHFYTADSSERDSVVAAGWHNEGIGWTAPLSGDEVYRLYNPYAGEHHYTLDSGERDSLVGAGWVDEGVGWFSDPEHAVPLYREYNPNAFACNHNYTADAGEHGQLVGAGWQDEGVAWYGIAADPAALDEAALRAAVAAQSDDDTLYFYYADFDVDGAKEAFAITGEEPSRAGDGWEGWEHGTATLWFADAHGNVIRVASGYDNLGSMSNGVVWDRRGSGRGFLSLERYAGGSGSSSCVYGVRDGEPVAVPFAIDWVGSFRNDDAGALVGYTSYFGNQFHQRITHAFALDESAFQFVETWASEPWS